MKEITVTKYEAFDGKQFESEEKCNEYEFIMAEIRRINKLVPERPDGTDFINGYGYVQHTPESFLKMRDSFIDLAFRMVDTGDQWYRDAEDIKTEIRLLCKERHTPVNGQYLGRFLESMGASSLIVKELNRVCCTDEKLREWGQMYYALNSDKGKLEQLN